MNIYKSVKYKKGSNEYLMDVADYTIGDLVHEKEYLYKAYDYYNGIRDVFQYENLEKNFGIGNPTSVEFVPLIRKHIDAIVGEYLTTKISPKVSCKDEKTLTNINRDKQLEISAKTHQYLKKFLENTILEAIAGQPQQDEKIIDPVIEKELKAIEESVSRNFISNYEIAGQNIVEYILQSRKMDFKNKLQQMLLDLLIAGQTYYKVVEAPAGSSFRIEVYSPLNVFVDKNPKTKYMKDGYRSVVRKWMTTEEIIITYGKDLTQKDIDSLDDYIIYDQNNSHFRLITDRCARCGEPPTRCPGMYHGEGVYFDEDTDESAYFGDSRQWNLIPVYEVEWIDYKKEGDKIVGKKYEVVRIGTDIYILKGEDKKAIRDMDAPNEVKLSINGMYYTNQGAPYSLMLATCFLQDKFDLLYYFKDNVIALSGTKGANVDLAHLPTALGDTMEERLTKYQAYRKTGLALFDSSQEGEMINTGFGGYDDSIDVHTIQAIDLAIERVEQTASSITGVFRERLGGIEARDAVTNVELGMQQSYVITKQYYQAMDTLVQEILTDALNMAKRVFKKGMTGQLILGDKKEIFTLLPEYYSFTDFDIHLADSTEIMKEQEFMKQLAMELTKNGQVDPTLMVIVSTSKSLTEMKDAVMKAIEERKIENNQIQQLQQQLQQTQQNLDQVQKQLEASTKKITQLNAKKMAIEQQDNVAKQEIEWYKVKSADENKKAEIDLIKQRNKLEALQLVDNSKDNDEIVNDKY